MGDPQGRDSSAPSDSGGSDLPVGKAQSNC
jgi:hypothetical protein